MLMPMSMSISMLQIVPGCAYGLQLMAGPPFISMLQISQGLASSSRKFSHNFTRISPIFFLGLDMAVPGHP